MSTLGGQQQTIAQNKQCYPLTTLSKLSTLLAGANVPTKTTTTLCMSPFSTLGTLGAGADGLFSQTANPVTGKLNPSLYTNILGQLGFNGGGTGVAVNPAANAGGAGTTTSSDTTPGGYLAPSPDTSNVQGSDCFTEQQPGAKRGGLIHAYHGCSSTKHRGALPGRD